MPSTCMILGVPAGDQQGQKTESAGPWLPASKQKETAGGLPGGECPLAACSAQPPGHGLTLTPTSKAPARPGPSVTAIPVRPDPGCCWPVSRQLVKQGHDPQQVGRGRPVRAPPRRRSCAGRSGSAGPVPAPGPLATGLPGAGALSSSRASPVSSQEVFQCPEIRTGLPNVGRNGHNFLILLPLSFREKYRQCLLVSRQRETSLLKAAMRRFKRTIEKNWFC